MSSLRDLVWQSYSKFSRHLILSSVCFPNTCRSKFYFIKTENLGKCQRNALWIFAYDKFSCPYLALHHLSLPKLASIVSRLTEIIQLRWGWASLKSDGGWYSTCTAVFSKPVPQRPWYPLKWFKGSSTLICNINIW